MRWAWLGLGALAGLSACGSQAREQVNTHVEQLEWVEEQKLRPNDVVWQDGFGVELALGPSTLLVNAPWQGNGVGALYVFERQGHAWQLQQKLLNSDTGFYDGFATAIGLSGDTAIATSTPQQGAYVFTRSGTVWTEQKKLQGSDATGSSNFGVAAALDDDTAVVGANLHANKGAAYVFVRNNGTWTEQKKLTASDGVDGDRFGRVVSISGDTALVTDLVTASGKGAAYVFVRNGGTWTEQKKLTASDGANNDYFGFAAQVDGDTAVVCARPAATKLGTAYVFVRSGTTWTEQQKLHASDGVAADYFASACSLHGDTLVVGASDAYADQGAGYVFGRNGGTWTEQKILTWEKERTNGLGYTVATNGRDAVLASSDDFAYSFHLGALNGEACTVDQDCTTGVCTAEQVCCESACAGPCESCIAARKASGPDGVCGLVEVGTDPRESCTEQPASSCGSTGLCDAEGACAVYAPGTVCGESSCPSATAENPTDVCDGAGQCQVAGVAACVAGYLCLEGACKTACESDADCDGDNAFVCGSGICKVPSAEPCEVDGDCDSGHCADGLCCDQACDGQCEACAEPKHEGICVAVTGEPRSARSACDSVGDATCGARCDGVKRDSCRYVPASTDCACAGPASANQCDGQGFCSASGSHSCSGFLCRDQACLTECVGNQDCSTGYSCQSGKCLPSTSGGTCSDDLTTSTVADKLKSCAPFKCDSAVGVCRERCSNTDDCLGSAICNPSSGQCEDGSGAPEAEGCGCRAVGAPARRLELAWFALALLVVAGRRRQRTA